MSDQLLAAIIVIAIMLLVGFPVHEFSHALAAFRLGDSCWGVQFHPEVTELQLGRWISDESDPPPEPERMRTETRERIGGWNELGRRLCRSFLAAAERLRAG